MKTVAILQPSYLPWLGYFDQIRRADVFVLYDDVQYDKHGWRNRNRIKTPQGPHWLTVPVRASGLDKPLNRDVQIDNRLPWARKQLGTIRQFYAKAPYLGTYLPPLEAALNQKWHLLLDLDRALLDLCCAWLQIPSPTTLSSQLNIEGGQTERLVRICQHFQATHYLSGNAAQSYLDVAIFAAAGIEVVWQNYQHPVYSQLHGEYCSHLSVLDLLFNCGNKSPSIIENIGTS